MSIACTYARRLVGMGLTVEGEVVYHLSGNQGKHEAFRAIQDDRYVFRSMN